MVKAWFKKTVKHMCKGFSEVWVKKKDIKGKEGKKKREKLEKQTNQKHNW